MIALEVYGVLGALFLLTAWAGRLDVDAGGYEDTFFTEHLRHGGGLWYTVHRIARDKLEHAALGFGLCFLAALVSQRPAGAFGVTVALGAGWELMQALPRGGFRRPDGTVKRRGFASWRDLVADAVGAALGALLAAGIVALLRGR